MKKIKLNNKRIIFEILVIIILVSLSFNLILKEPIGNLDELWQYSFARNILNGKIPYNDFNIIVTPLFSAIASIFLRIFSDQLLVMRCFNATIYFLILYITYTILKELKLNKYISLGIVLFIYYMFVGIIGVEYNYLLLLLILLMVKLELRDIRNNEEFGDDIKVNFYIGIISGLAILTKQTIGIIMALISIVNKIILIRSKNEKIMQNIYLIFMRSLGTILPCLIFLIYLISKDALYNFISYCFLGVLEFSNKISYTNLFTNDKIFIRSFGIVIPILVIIMPIIFFIINKKNIFNNYKKMKNTYITLYIYSTSMLIGMFPGPNAGHFIIYAYIFILMIFIIIYNILIKKIKMSSKYHLVISNFFKFFILMVSIYLMIIGTINTISSYKNNDISNLNHFKNIPISNNMQRWITSIEDYIIKEKHNDINVIILDSSATIFMIPLDIYNKDFDTFNRGNFGYNGENRLINLIESKEKTKYLILNQEYNKNWQTPLKIIEYTLKNKNKIGEIMNFDIYE